MNKEMKIQGPEGHEIDRENSTLEHIKFKPVESIPTTFEEICLRMNQQVEYFKSSKYETEADAAARKIKLIVKYFNKGEKLDWDNTSQPKYRPYFDLRNNDVTLGSVLCSYYYSVVPPSFCFVREEDAEYVAKTFINIYKQMYK